MARIFSGPNTGLNTVRSLSGCSLSGEGLSGRLIPRMAQICLFAMAGAVGYSQVLYAAGLDASDHGVSDSSATLDKQKDFYPVELDLSAGLDFQSYSESGSLALGNIKTDYDATLPSGRGSVKLFFDERHFLLFNGNITLYQQQEAERWKLDGNLVQTNQLEIERSAFSLQYGQRFAKRHDVHLGIGISQNNYLRYGFVYTDLGETTFPKADGSAYTDSDRQALLNSEVEEEMLSVNLLGGYSYSNFFSESKPGLRYRLSAQVGIPAYFRVTNKNGSNYTTLTSEFEGIDLQSALAVGWQFDQHWLLYAGLSSYYERRDKILSTSLALPDAELYGFETQLGFVTRF